MTDAGTRLERRRPWPGGAWFVAAVYVFLLGVVWYRARHYGYTFPWSDDWAVLPQLTGQEPLSWSWLFSSHNEHRIPLARLYLLTSFHLTGGDYRWMAFGNSMLLAGVGVYFNFALAEARGRVAWSDAVVPAALLSFAHVGNFWTFQALFVLSTVGLLVSCASLVRLTSPGRASERPVAWAGVYLGVWIACLSGVPGLILASVLTLYLVAERLAPRLGARSTRGRSRPWTLALAILSLSLCALLIAATLGGGRGLPAPAGVTSIVLTVGRMLVAPLGAQGSGWWPWSVVLPLTLLIPWLARLPGALSRSSSDAESATYGVEAARLGAVIAALLLLFVALGLGRGETPNFPMAHYALLGMPLYLMLYLWFERLGGGSIRAVSRSVVVLAVAAGWLLNVGVAFEWGRANQANGRAFRQSVLSGESADQIAAKHVGALSHVDTPGMRSVIADGLRALQAAQVEPYQCIGAALGGQSNAALPPFCRPAPGSPLIPKEVE